MEKQPNWKTDLTKNIAKSKETFLLKQTNLPEIKQYRKVFSSLDFAGKIALTEMEKCRKQWLGKKFTQDPIYHQFLHKDLLWKILRISEKEKLQERSSKQQWNLICKSVFPTTIKKEMIIFQGNKKKLFCHRCMHKGHLIQHCFYEKKKKSFNLKDNYNNQLHNFVKNLEQVQLPFYDADLPLIEKFRKETIRILKKKKEFWKRFSEFTQFQYKKDTSLPETFSATSKCIGTWWSLGSPIPQLLHLITGYRIEFLTKLCS